MKKIILYFIFVCFYLSNTVAIAQVQSYSNSSNGSTTLLPHGLFSSKTGNTKDDSNLALGIGALSNVGAISGRGIGKFNTALGTDALYNNYSGTGNTATGYNSLYSNGSKTGNTASGSFALYSNTLGSSNTACGYYALYSNTTGSYNTAGGRKALKDNTTGFDNTAIGAYVLANNTTGSSNTAIGYSALSGNRIGSYNTAIGRWTLLAKKIGDKSTCVGCLAGGVILTFSADTLANSIAIGYLALVDTYNKIRMGNTNITSAEVQVPWSATSDKRWKEEIRPVPLGLDFVYNLNPVSYHRKNNRNQDRELGLIAQEVIETLNKHGMKDEQLGMVRKDSRGYHSMRYNDLISVLIRALQEQQGVIEKQRAKIDNLKRNVLSINMQFDSLESPFSSRKSIKRLNPD